MIPVLSSEDLPNPRIQVRCWGEQCVAYSISSGDSHLISALAGQALIAVGNGIADFDVLAQVTARALGVDPNAEFIASLRETAAELEAKGLLSHSCCSPN
jgi:PqqD family protein of HPr-rel-A system